MNISTFVSNFIMLQDIKPDFLSNFRIARGAMSQVLTASTWIIYKKIN